MAHYKRITKRENFKGPDEFIGFWQKAVLWVREKGDALILPALGAAVALALVLGFFFYRQQRVASANRELFNILKDLPRPGAPSSATPEQMADALKSHADKFSGTPSGRIGQLYRANIMCQKKNWDEAANLYRSLMEGGTDVVAQRAGIALANALQEQGKYADAISVLEKIRQTSPFAEETDYAIARNQELNGNKAAAVREYQAFVEKHPASQRAGTARERAAKLS